MEALILRGAIAERICKSVITYNVTVNGADDTRFSMVWSNISLFAKETYIWVLNQLVEKLGRINLL